MLFSQTSCLVICFMVLLVVQPSQQCPLSSQAYTFTPVCTCKLCTGNNKTMRQVPAVGKLITAHSMLLAVWAFFPIKCRHLRHLKYKPIFPKLFLLSVERCKTLLWEFRLNLWSVIKSISSQYCLLKVPVFVPQAWRNLGWGSC